MPFSPQCCMAAKPNKVLHGAAMLGKTSGRYIIMYVMINRLRFHNFSHACKTKQNTGRPE